MLITNFNVNCSINHSISISLLQLGNGLERIIQLANSELAIIIKELKHPVLIMCPFAGTYFSYVFHQFLQTCHINTGAPFSVCPSHFDLGKGKAICVNLLE